MSFCHESAIFSCLANQTFAVKPAFQFHPEEFPRIDNAKSNNELRRLVDIGGGTCDVNYLIFTRLDQWRGLFCRRSFAFGGAFGWYRPFPELIDPGHVVLAVFCYNPGHQVLLPVVPGIVGKTI